MVDQCHSCNIECNLLQYSACKQLPDAYYCSRDCKIADWNKHKIDCCKLAQVLGVTEDDEELDSIYYDEAGW